MTFKCFNNLSPAYMNYVFMPSGQNSTTTRVSLLKINQPMQTIIRFPENKFAWMYN